ncbi:MAG: hypothetical protein Q7W45_01515 [Bacteroidota bacterium]|nr:hypothetical protein [Bacteroidota bacterium]MDP3147203.1 hypothetical protein [Bacteroidota bacterium]
MWVLRKICFVIIALIIFCSCRKPASANWDVDVVFPVVKSTLNIKNFIGDSIFVADNTGLLSLNVTREIISIKLDSLLKLPDTTIVNTFTIPAVFPTTLTPGQALTFFPASELNFNISNGVAIKKLDIRSGILMVKFTNDLAEPLDLLYIIPSAVKNGQPLKIFETIPPNNVPLIKSYSLAGYTLNMRGLNGVLYNTIAQAYTVTVNPNANPVVVTFGQGAKATLSYSNIIPDYVEGYFGQQTIALPLDTARFDVFNNFQASNFLLNSASINFKILNEFGAEFTSNLSNIQSVNSINNTTVALTGGLLSNININRASKVGATIYPSIKSISVTNTNSNIVPFLSNLPNKLTYQGSIDVNPLGNISGYNDFAFYNTGIKVLADINIPLRFNADYFKLTSTSIVDFSNVKQLENVNHGNFVISALNGYPFRAQIQAYLLDGNNLVVDSLFIPGANFIERGVLDAQNIVTSPTQSKLNTPISQAKIENLKKTKTIKLVTYFLMPTNPPDIKLYENYSFDVNIVAELNYHVNP